jgi:outer membrane protein OmpA-like peptidoglycan-associated protein
MRKLLLPIVAALSAASSASAQVTVDFHALEGLPAAKPAPAPPAPRPVVRPKITLAPTVAAPAPVPEKPAPAATVALPIAPPAVPVAPTAPPPVAEAPKPATSIRIPFAAEQTDLSKDGIAAVEKLIETAYANSTSNFSVVAYASGKPDDPSSARRLSLARALAARTVLQNNSVPSRKITVRALGNQAGDGPPDRVDIVASAGGTP